MSKGETKYDLLKYLDTRSAIAGLTYREVREEYTRAVKKANRRIQALQRAGIELQSMSTAFALVGGKEFKTISKVDKRHLRRELARVQVFLNTQGSSVAALRIARAARQKSLKELARSERAGSLENVDLNSFFNIIRNVFRGFVEPPSDRVIHVYNKYILMGNSEVSSILINFDDYMKAVE